MATHLDNETELVTQAKQGDHQAFATLVKQYERNIYRLALNFVRDPSEAEDVLQETFLRAYLKLEQFNGDSRFYTWLVRIAVNIALMELRGRRPQKFVSLDDPMETNENEIPREVENWTESPERIYVNEELRQILQNGLSALQPSFRAVVHLRDIEGYTTEEAAALLNLSVAATKSRLMRARLKLREYLNGYFRPTAATQDRRGRWTLPQVPESPLSGVAVPIARVVSL